MRPFFALTLSTLLIACAGTAPTPFAPAAVPPEAPAAAALPSPAPAGSGAPEAAPAADAIPAGLAPTDQDPPAFAIGAPGKGALIEGGVFTVRGEVIVYRVWSASYESTKRASPRGAYWSLERPAGSKRQYRNDYAICTAWNDLDRVSACSIEIGATVVIGPGQSVTCDGGEESYPASPARQVLILRKEDGSTPVTACKDADMTWSD